LPRSRTSPRGDCQLGRIGSLRASSVRTNIWSLKRVRYRLTLCIGHTKTGGSPIRGDGERGDSPCNAILCHRFKAHRSIS
jgi:hypothetical protein